MKASGNFPLAGKHFWLTRPAVQLQDLRAELEALGATITCLPLLQIVPVNPSGAHKQRVMDLDHYDMVFFVSTNAAKYGLEAIEKYWPQYPVGIQNFAVGPSTARVIEQKGLEVVYPRERMSSEAMLALPQLQHISGKKALIVRGIGGREILAEALQARGAKVDYVELYQRLQPIYPQDYLLSLLETHKPTAVVVSSAEALDNLKELFAPLLLWTRLPVVVSSERLAEHALTVGKKVVGVIEGASDAAIIQGLSDCFS